jgi:hypothetical protein
MRARLRTLLQARVESPKPLRGVAPDLDAVVQTGSFEPPAAPLAPPAVSVRSPASSGPSNRSVATAALADPAPAIAGALTEPGSATTVVAEPVATVWKPEGFVNPTPTELRFKVETMRWGPRRRLTGWARRRTR